MISMPGAKNPEVRQEEQLPLRTEFLMQMSAELEDPQPIGETPAGTRRILYVKGGEFWGPSLRGKLLPGGGDWLLFRNDGVGVLDVRITLCTDDGALVYATYRGISDMEGGLRQRILNGEEVSPSQYYFRITPYFETSSESYSWLNKLVAVGVGKREKNSVHYSIYAVK